MLTIGMRRVESDLKLKRHRSVKWFHTGLILTIILITAWLRFWRLADTPPGLDYDEAYNGLDAIWMLENGEYYLFVPSNHGREALFFYPTALFVKLLGAMPFALRFPAALAGILTIPLTYRLAKELFYKFSSRYWLALIAMAGLSVSFWHISLSRQALRANLIPPFFALTTLLFWLGWRVWWAQLKTGGPVKLSCKYFVGVGIVLGLSQYTYTSARLIPLVLLLFTLGQWLIAKFASGSIPWLGLILSGLISLLTFIPLGIVSLNSNAALVGRANQITYQLEWSANGIMAAVQHTAEALMLFIGGADPRIRYHLIERPVFDALVLVSFWIGLILALKNWRQPWFFFVGLSLAIMWLPAPLSVDPIHSLRSAGILPVFFILMAVGLFQAVTWITKNLSGPARQIHPGLFSLGLVLLVSGGINTFDYFIRWANDLRVYSEYEGPSLELAETALALTNQATDIILPYHFYAYPPVRYLLHNTFEEELGLPFAPGNRLAEGKRIIHFGWPMDEPRTPLFVWLTRDDTGPGKAYLTDAIKPDLNDLPASAITGPTGMVIGTSLPLDEKLLNQVLLNETIAPTSLIWGKHIHLRGYSPLSQVIQVGDSGLLTLYWQGLHDADLAYNVFIQILDQQGQPVTQFNEPIIAGDKKPYYQNRIGLVYQNHLFWTGLDMSPGLYLIRVGLFRPETGERLPITTVMGETVGDQVILLPFYVQANNSDPRIPAVSLKANLGHDIKLLGYSLVPSLDNLTLNVNLYWQTAAKLDRDYTAFVQLLDGRNVVVSQWDAQPLNGLYPTSRWQIGQVVLSQFSLPFNPNLSTGPYRLVTGMYNLDTGVRLPVFDNQGQRLANDMITLKSIVTGVTP